MFGAPAEDRERLAAAIDAQGEAAFEVWPENWDVVRLFCRLQTQWRIVAGMGGSMWQGFDYAAVWAVLRGLRIKDPAATFTDLQIMESAALSVLNKAKGP